MEVSVPPYFLCPISLQIMKDPMIVPTGITYDRESIEKWVYLNNKTTCPVTKQPLSSASQSGFDFLTPNHTLRRLIQSWCMLNASDDIERFPTPKPPTSHSQIKKLIEEAVNHQGRVKCLNRLRSIASHSTASKRCLESSGAVEFLGKVVLEEGPWSSEALGVLSLLRISEEKVWRLLEMNEGNGALVNALTRVLKECSYELRGHAIVLMKLLIQTANDDPSRVVATFETYHFVEVVRILRDTYQISPEAVKAALKVLALACPWGRNRVKAVEAGAVPTLIDLLLEASPADGRRSSEMALTILDQLCGSAEGRAEFLGHAVGLAIVSRKILRVSHYATERGVRIFSSISRFSANPTVLREMVEVGVVSKLCMVLQVESEAKTKEKVREVLKLHGRAWSNSPCAPPNLLALPN